MHFYHGRRALRLSQPMFNRSRCTPLSENYKDNNGIECYVDPSKKNKKNNIVEGETNDSRSCNLSPCRGLA